MFNYTCIKGGKERKYLLYKADTGFSIDLIHEKDSTERSGVTVSIPVKSYDFWNFNKEIKSQLAYFDNVYFDVHNDDLNTGYMLFQSDDFQWCNLIKGREMHITLGRVNYPISWTALDISPIYIPVALRFELDSGIFPIPNRENIIWNDKTKKLVREKIEAVANWFVDKYNKTVKDMNGLYEAWEFINMNQHYVELEGNKFDVTTLEQYSKNKFKEPIIKGIELLTPSFYKSKFPDLILNLRVVGDYRNGTLRTKNTYNNMRSIIDSRRKGMQLDDNVVISGFFREYLKTLGYTVFVKHVVDIKHPDLEYYKQVLPLHNKTKDKWRPIIEEFKAVQKEFLKELLADGTTLQDSDEFKKYKEDSKSKRRTIPKKKATILKTREDVSIYYPKIKMGGGWMWERRVIKLDELHKNGFISIVMNETEQADMGVYAYTYSAQKTLQFARIGVQDAKKINKLKLNNFMTINDLDKTKAFRRVVTAIRAKQLVALYEKLTDNKVEVVRNCAAKFHELYLEVKRYADNNYTHNYSTTDAQVSAMVNVAIQNDIWDLTFIVTLKKFEKGLDDFSFLKHLEEPESNDKETILTEYTELINSLLLMKKMRNENKFSNMEICVKNDVPLDETKLVNKRKTTAKISVVA